MTIPRHVAAETLDHLAPEAPAAMRSRRDLVRVHRAMGTRSILIRGWRGLLETQRDGLPLRILEIGAGDGSLLLGVARTMAKHWPPVQLTLLDRQDIVRPETLAAYAELGWATEVLVADVLSWADMPDGSQSSAPMARWDLISTTLFLHHFEGGQLDRLLAAVAARTDRFFACEPKRSWLPLVGSHLVGAIGANAVTREDAVLSVHAGFCDQEITAMWTRASGTWQTREFAAGMFSHCFSAQRVLIDGWTE
jgi:hypothetical protein